MKCFELNTFMKFGFPKIFITSRESLSTGHLTSLTQIKLSNHGRWLEASKFKFKNLTICTGCLANLKVPFCIICNLSMFSHQLSLTKEVHFKTVQIL